AGAGAECFGEGFAGLLDGAPGAAAGRVEGGGVAGDAQVRGERLDRLGEHRGGRGVVEVSHGGADSTGRGAAGTDRGWVGWGRLGGFLSSYAVSRVLRCGRRCGRRCVLRCPSQGFSPPPPLPVPSPGAVLPDPPFGPSGLVLKRRTG